MRTKPIHSPPKRYVKMMLSLLRNTSFRSTNSIHAVVSKTSSTSHSRRRWMGGGSSKKSTLHSKHMHPKSKHKKILRYCDELLGATNSYQTIELLMKKSSPGKQKKRALQQNHASVSGMLETDKMRFVRARDQWIKLETLLYCNTFRGWTKIQTFVDAFSKSNHRYELKQVDNPAAWRPNSSRRLHGKPTMWLVRINRNHPMYCNGDGTNEACNNNDRKAASGRNMTS